MHVAVDAVGSLRARITVRGSRRPLLGQPRAPERDRRGLPHRAHAQPSAAGRCQHERRPDPGRYGGECDRRPRRVGDRAARARRDAALPFRARARHARRWSRRSASRSRRSAAPGRPSRPPPAAAGDGAARARGAGPAGRAGRGLDRRQRGARSRHPRALPRLRAGRRDAHARRVHRDRLAGDRARAAAARAARIALGESDDHAHDRDRPPARPAQRGRAEAAVACVRRTRGLARRRALRQRRATRTRQGAARAWRAGGAPPPREAALVVLAGRAHARGGRRARRPAPSSSWEHVPGVQPRSPPTSSPSPRWRCKADPGFRAALALRGDRRPRARHGRHLVGRRCSRSTGLPRRARAGVAAQRSHRRQRLRASDRRPARDRRPRHAWTIVRIDDHGVVPVPREHGDYRDGGGRRLPRRPAADRGHPARGLEPAARRPSAQLGPVASAHRLQPARGAHAARAGLRRGRRRRAAADRPPALDRRARDSLRRHESDGRASRTPSTSASTASGRTPTRSSSAATAWARSATSTPSCTTARGRAQTIANAICLHEEDAGILWKHYDWRSGATDVRRARKLVISTIVTVGNYEYGLYWYLTLDGGIAFEAKLTGVLHTAGVAARDESGVGDAGRARRQRGLPPALLLRAPRPRHRRRAQRALRGRLAARSARAGEPAPPVASACARRRSRASSRPSA